MISPLMADLVLLIHFFIVIFLAFGLFLVPIGHVFSWFWVKNRLLRKFHVVMMLIVTLESILGITCPLTYIENSLRGIYEAQSFVAYWVRQIVFWDLPTEFFLTLYCICLLWTLLMWKLFPPRSTN